MVSCDQNIVLFNLLYFRSMMSGYCKVGANAGTTILSEIK
jgi:hypothetical protein